MTGEGERDLEVFSEAIQLPFEERTVFLDRACAEDVDLRRRVGDFLETPPTAPISDARAKVAAGEHPGDRIDRYILLQQIGEGGCGVVFLAEQKEPVARCVALKVVKPGM